MFAFELVCLRMKIDSMTYEGDSNIIISILEFEIF